MKIAIDLKFNYYEPTGVGRYAENIAAETKKMKNVKAVVFRNDLPKKKPKNFFHRLFRLPKYGPWLFLELPKILEMEKFDAAFFPNFVMPFSSPCKSIIFVHDVNFLKNPKLYTIKHMLFHSPFTIISAKNCDLILCPSEFQKNDIAKVLNVSKEKIKAIYYGLNHEIFKKIRKKRLNAFAKKHDLPEKFCLYVSEIKKNKGLDIALNALIELKEKGIKLNLVVIGPKGNSWSEIKKIVEKNSLKNQVKFLGYLEQREIAKAYNLAEFFVFPSHCEGFGMPLIESMACGLPVIASNAPAIPEIAGNSAVYFEDKNFKELAKLMESFSKNPLKRKLYSMRGLKHSKKFSWKKCAKQTIEEIKKVVKQKA